MGLLARTKEQDNGRKKPTEKRVWKEEKVPTVWFTLKRSLHCKSGPSDVYEPKSRGHDLGTILTKRKGGRSGCSRSMANLKDVIHGSMRHIERPASCSPRSIGSSEFLNPITHEVVLSDSRCELRITGLGGHGEEVGNGGGRGVSSTYLGTIRPGTPGPGGGHHSMQMQYPSPPRRSPSRFGDRGGYALRGFPPVPDAVLAHGGIGGGGHHVPSSAQKAPQGGGSNVSSGNVNCHRCGEQFGKWEALEAHHLSKHAVSELLEGDSSRRIVEIICRASWLKSEGNCGRIERILKIHNTQKTLVCFEEYREMVKIRASKLPKKHPRCLADGNELLRFYGTTVSCPLGLNGSSNLCPSEKCNVCGIIRLGFSTRKEIKGRGVFTTSTSSRAFESIEILEDNLSVRKALIVCRVIAGRVHRPLDNYQELAGQSGFDSLAGKVGLYANIEELYLLSPRALLPCFVVICMS